MHSDQHCYERQVGKIEAPVFFMIPRAARYQKAYETLLLVF